MKDTIYIREGDRITSENGERDIIIIHPHFSDVEVADVIPVYEDEETAQNAWLEKIGERLDRSYIMPLQSVARIAGARHAYFDDDPTTYWFPNEGEHDVFGNGDPCCFDTSEAYRLSREWNVNLFEQLHRATPDEIAQYGIYD